MTTHQFGGSWTKEKLERVRQYLVAYVQIFDKNPKAQFYTTTYVDAFAGTGSRVSRKSKPTSESLFDDPDRDAYLKGSARIALELDPGFRKYLFIESNPKFVSELEKLREEYPHKSSQIEIVKGEANAYLKSWCSITDWTRNRAVVFLDPYGMEVEWSLIKTLGETKAIDLWLLFPLGVAVNRMLTRHEPPPAEWSNRLTKLFGTEEWQSAFYQTQITPTLFGDKETQIKDADFDRIGRFFTNRMKSVFADVAKPFALRNSKNSPIYLLCFAVGNPAPKAKTLALRIANYILSH